jgi:hypothetical protein
MAIDEDNFCGLRPYLWHYTAAENLKWIKADKRIACANTLIDQASLSDPNMRIWRRKFRERRVQLDLPDGRTISLREHHASLPEHQGAYEKGWDRESFIEGGLNAYIFFWAGTRDGPSHVNLVQFQAPRYRSEAWVRIPSRVAFSRARALGVSFTRCNAGSPSPRGNAEPRGAETFMQRGSFSGTAGDVVEVCFSGVLSLQDVEHTTGEP